MHFCVMILSYNQFLCEPNHKSNCYLSLNMRKCYFQNSKQSDSLGQISPLFATSRNAALLNRLFYAALTIFYNVLSALGYIYCCQQLEIVFKDFIKSINILFLMISFNFKWFCLVCSSIFLCGVVVCAVQKSV